MTIASGKFSLYVPSFERFKFDLKSKLAKVKHSDVECMAKA